MELLPNDFFLAVWAVKDETGLGLLIMVRREGSWYGEFEYGPYDEEAATIKWALRPNADFTEAEVIQCISGHLETGFGGNFPLGEVAMIGCVETRTHQMEKVVDSLKLLRTYGFLGHVDGEENLKEDDDDNEFDEAS